MPRRKREASTPADRKAPRDRFDRVLGHALGTFGALLVLDFTRDLRAAEREANAWASMIPHPDDCERCGAERTLCVCRYCDCGEKWPSGEHPGCDGGAEIDAAQEREQRWGR